jgi:hypothetical protein
MFGEAPEEFWHLVLEEPLLASARVDPGQDRTELARLIAECLVEVNEATHRANQGIIALI